MIFRNTDRGQAFDFAIPQSELFISSVTKLATLNARDGDAKLLR